MAGGTPQKVLLSSDFLGLISHPPSGSTQLLTLTVSGGRLSHTPSQVRKRRKALNFWAHYSSAKPGPMQQVLPAAEAAASELLQEEKELFRLQKSPHPRLLCPEALPLQKVI